MAGPYPEVDDGVGGGVAQEAFLSGAAGQRDPDPLQEPGPGAHGVVLVVSAQEDGPSPVPAPRERPSLPPAKPGRDKRVPYALCIGTCLPIPYPIPIPYTLRIGTCLPIQVYCLIPVRMDWHAIQNDTVTVPGLTRGTLHDPV